MEFKERYLQSVEKPYILEEEEPTLQKLPIDEEEYKEGPLTDEKVRKIRESIIPRGMDDEEVTPLKIEQIGPKVIGNLFDRVEFLKQRISETNEALETRKQVHEENIAEITEDIEDRSRILKSLADIDDIRDFKLDVSMLRREKRKEDVQFWKDLLELKTVFQELIEEYRMESKISELFKDTNTDSGD